ncbi:DUF2326 domain-containing protein [Brachyspira pilosicoli]|uniref:DUF2326 domain-containing protein n=1 Tax=Brachyspira pilosicoli TaxID=52584 RepID=UPI0012F4AAB1|nr:DUF2326 domain-containing protein [Brachyspira pilosicoli]
MRLIRLTSNKPQFNDVVFKQISGINIIKASRFNKDKSIDDSKNTYNGLGKSLIIHLIDFCLLSDEIEEFKEKLSDWSFTLFFTINGEEYSIERFCNNQKIVLFNNKEYTLKVLKELLFEELFDKDTAPSSASFRSMISRFLRSPRKETGGYYDTIKPNTVKEQDYQSLLYTSWLLGIDTSLIEKKFNLIKDRDDELRKAKDIKEYELRNINAYIKNKNKPKIDIEIRDLSEEISKLSKELNEYKVAYNYQNIQNEADYLTSDLRNLDDDIYSCKNVLEQISVSLKLKSDVTFKELENLFSEVKLLFPEQVKKTIKDVELFHNQMVIQRKKSLELEQKEYIKKLDSLNKEREIIANKRDDCIKYLGAHKALDEYKSLQEKIINLRDKKSNLEKYLKILNKEETIKDDFNLKMSEYNIEAKNYIEENNIKDSLTTKFRELSSRFYKDKAGGITVYPNNRDNKKRFDIDIMIDDDDSSGISEVKMFCFDVLITILHNHHNINFIFHDSQLFANMDPRQRLIVFKTMKDITTKYGIQYICTVNEDQLDFNELNITEEEYNSLIEENIILELTDENDSKKLLGERISINL